MAIALVPSKKLKPQNVRVLLVEMRMYANAGFMKRRRWSDAKIFDRVVGHGDYSCNDYSI